MSGVIDTPEQSPDYLGAERKAKGIRRPNKLPWLIAMGILVVILLVVNYSFGVSADSVSGGTGEGTGDAGKITGAAVPPVKKPAGPDVNLPATTVHMMQERPEGIAAPMESEAERNARQKKADALQAALNSDPGIDKFGMHRPAQQQDNRNQGMPQPNPYAMIPPPPPSRAYDEDGYGAGDINQQGHKKEFSKASNDDESPYLKHTRMPAISPAQLNAGSVIPGVMISGVNSDLPGQIVGQVRQNVYDSATGRYLLIPAGAKLVGTYDSAVSAGQERVLVAWNRVMFPDGSSLNLSGMPGADQGGYAGFHDQVNNHYLRIFGSAAMLSLFSAAVQLSQPRGPVSGSLNSSQIASAAMGQQLFALSSQLIRRGLSIQPTLEIRPGLEFTISVTKDIILPPWQGHPMVRNGS